MLSGDYVEKFQDFIGGLQGESVLGWTHNRPDPDAEGSAGLMSIIMDHYGRSFSCLYSKRMAYLENRHIDANFLPKGLLQRQELVEDLPGMIESSAGAMLIDTSCYENVNNFSSVLENPSYHDGKKNIFTIDHHKNGNGDNGIVLENAGSTVSILTSLIDRLGIPFKDDHQGILAAAYRGLQTDTQDLSQLNDIDQFALDYLEHHLTDASKEDIERISQLKAPFHWMSALGFATSGDVDKYDKNVAIIGLGVVPDNGIYSYVSHEMLKLVTKSFYSSINTVIVFGLTYETIADKIYYVDLDASGRTENNNEIKIEELFHDLFYKNGEDGNKISYGGGRSHDILGHVGIAGASIPMQEYIGRENLANYKKGIKDLDDHIDALKMIWDNVLKIEVNKRFLDAGFTKFHLRSY